MNGKLKIDIIVYNFLKKYPEEEFNLSEIARGIDKSVPTVTRSIGRLIELDKVTMTNKRSMKLVRLNLS
jgi:Mn-dependent DtxR family transcriptional regulator